MQAAAEAETLGAQQAHEQQMDESELAHMSELAELRDRVMELQTKDRHTPQELAELDMLHSRFLDFQVLLAPPPLPPPHPIPLYVLLHLPSAGYDCSLWGFLFHHSNIHLHTLYVSTYFGLQEFSESCTSLPVQLQMPYVNSCCLQLPHLQLLEQDTLHDLLQITHSYKDPRLLAVMLAFLCVQERTAAPGQSEQQEDEEKAALRQHIQQLQDAAATGEGAALASQATDQERLEAALQQERLQARIRQLEVTLPPLSLSCLHAAHAETVLMQLCQEVCQTQTALSVLVCYGPLPKGGRPVCSYTINFYRDLKTCNKWSIFIFRHMHSTLTSCHLTHCTAT